MSIELDNQGFEQYRRYHEAQRHDRIETLGGAVTAIVLATVDLGLSEIHDPAGVPRRASQEQAVSREADIIPLRTRRERRLADFAVDHAELGYGRAA